MPGKAKNVVFFLGDGMGVSTLTTARVHKGQQRAGMVGGEQEKLVFEQFPHLGQLLMPISTSSFSALFRTCSFTFTFTVIRHFHFHKLFSHFQHLCELTVMTPQLLILHALPPPTSVG